MGDGVRIVEVGPRDGLQNEAETVPVEARIAFVQRLVDAGCRTVEVGSFVSPRWVPQMAGTALVLSAMAHNVGRSFPVLVPNEQGLDAALAAGAREIAIFVSASEAFSHKNINCSVAKSLERLRPVAERAAAAGVHVRGYVSCVLGCPYEGAVDVRSVARVTADLRDLGCYEVSLGDTVGAGTPKRAAALVRTLASEVPVSELAVHFHDTHGQALTNIYACLEEGVRVLDSSAGGLGGCPYAPGASGNVATEDLLYMLDGLGFETGIDLDAVAGASSAMLRLLGREPQSKAARAVGARTGLGACGPVDAGSAPAHA